jgi:hypothetical protein
MNANYLVMDVRELRALIKIAQKHGNKSPSATVVLRWTEAYQVDDGDGDRQVLTLHMEANGESLLAAAYGKPSEIRS